MREGAGKANLQGTTILSAPSTSSVWNPNHRPYPFSPLFAKVVAHPPHDLARLIEATAFHTAKARDHSERKAFEQKLLSQDTNPEIAAFIDPAHLYHEYYAASVLWHQELLNRGTAAINPPETDCMITSVSTVQPPQVAPLLQLNAKKGALASKQIAAATKPAVAPKAMPRRTILPLRRAVSAVVRRRAYLAPRGKTQHDTVITIDLDDSLKTTPVAATLRPPLARRGAARKAQLTLRPPLPRRGKAAKPKLTLVDATTVVEQKWTPPQSTWDNSEQAHGGIMKVPVPNIGGIAQFYRLTLQPLAALMKMHISLVARCGLDDEIRVYYRHDKDPTPPIPIRAVTIEENADLRNVLTAVRGLVDYVYLEATLQGPSISYILNFWTDKGRLAQDALLATLHSALAFASTRTQFTAPSAALLLYQAFHLVILARASTQHSLLEQQQEMQTLMNTYLERNPVRAEGREWPLTLSFVIRSGGQMARGCPHIRLQTICEGGAPKSQTQKKQPRSRSRSPVWQPEAEAVEEAEVDDQGFNMDPEEPDDSQVWNLGDDPDLEQRTLHVSVSSEDPITITVPLYWPDPYVEKILARHMGVQHEWLQFEWIWDDLFVLPARSAPAQLKDLVLRQFTQEQEADNARPVVAEEQASVASSPAITTPIPKPSGIKPLTTPQDSRQPIGAPRARLEATPAKAMPKHTPAAYGNSSSSGTHANANTFESNVLARLDTIERQQTEVLRLLRYTLRPLVTKPLATPEAHTAPKAKPTASPTLAVGRKGPRGTRAGAFRHARASGHKRNQAATPQGPISPLPPQASAGDLPSPPWRF
eukprot:1808685-Amphidinium_carterae.1